MPSWNQVYEILLELAEQIQAEGFKPDMIVGISRGGLLPARVLSDLLEVARITSVGVEFYVGIYETNSEPCLTQQIPLSILDQKVLLVDDVVDTGKSALLIKEYLSRQGVREMRFLTLYYKPWSGIRPDFYSKETSEWIVFPWEVKETLVKLEKNSEKSNESLERAISRLTGSGVSKELVDRLLKSRSKH
ncbi:TPA: phosphoribosyltransferase [Candidatus Bathyarchaeota archaeon]|nr:phosphoribosyltransferase [Candidatus Bathyarchaeota archaeon]